MQMFNVFTNTKYQMPTVQTLFRVDFRMHALFENSGPRKKQMLSQKAAIFTNITFKTSDFIVQMLIMSTLCI